MTRLDIALRRAEDEAIDVRVGVRSDVVSELSQIVADELRARFPPEVESQLASLVQAVESHPDKPRILAFVASGSGAGTTTCVSSVGTYLAGRGARVLVVDANIHRPALHTATNRDLGPGLIEVITAETDLKTAARAADVPGLFVLTAGNPQPVSVSTLLRPSLLQERLLRQTADYDYVLVDCPAVNVYDEAAIAAAACDGVVLVVEGGRSREEAQASKARLTRANCKILGVFMNKRQFYVPKFLYDRL